MGAKSVTMTAKCMFIVLALALPGMLVGGDVAAESVASLRVERTIPLKGVSGRIDHMAVDLGRKRLFVAELGNGTVDVIDLFLGTVVHRIDRLKDPQGVGYVSGADVLAVASAGDGSVRLFRGTDLVPAGAVDLGDDADNVRVDAGSGHFVIGYGSGGLAVIDPVKAVLVGRIPLPAHPEGFQLDASTHRGFVNVPDSREIAVVDMGVGQQTNAWRSPQLRANFPMAFDATRGVVAVVYRSPARLVAFDANSGRAISSVTSCGDADDVFFDGKRRRIYVSCGDGSVDAWQEDGTGYRRLNSVKTATGARTSLFVPELDRLFVAARAGFLGLGGDAAILVLRPVD
jgi:hypothetical protein